MRIMNAEQITKFESDMAVFSFKQHQDVLTYLTHLKTMGWSIENAEDWIVHERQRITKMRGRVEIVTNKCLLCSAVMRLLPVNFTRATLTGDDSKSVWLCLNRKCMHTIYNKESIEEITKKGGK